jgi:TolA-binding protein
VKPADGEWPQRLVEGGEPEAPALRALAEDAPDAEARQRVWRSLGLRKPSPRRRALVWALAASAAVSVIAVVATRHEPAPAPEELAFCTVSEVAGDLRIGAPDRELVAAGVGAKVSTGSRVQTGPQSVATLAFDDSTRVALDSKTGVGVRRLPAGDEVELSGGQLRAQVTHQAPGKSFVVNAPGWRVRVVGTQFLVTTQGVVSVEVIEGTVSVESRTELDAPAVRVHAGECWDGGSRRVAPCRVPAARSEEPPPVETRAPRVHRAAQDKVVNVARLSPPPLVVAEPPPARLEPAPPSVPPPSTLHPHPDPLPPAGEGSPAESPEAQYDLAQRLARSGQFQDAAAMFAKVAVARGAYADLALFELGRLKQQRLSDPAGSLATFERYRREFPRGALRQEVDFSSIEALLSLSLDDRAGTAIDGFLSAYPKNERRGELLLVRGDLSRKKGDCARALSFYSQVEGGGAAADDALYAAAYCESRLEHDAEAQALLREYQSRFPKGRHSEDVKQALGE